MGTGCQDVDKIMIDDKAKINRGKNESKRDVCGEDEVKK